MVVVGGLCWVMCEENNNKHNKLKIIFWANL